METQVRTPQMVFMQPQRLIVPLFQRPYVWNEETQWEPLWEDVRRVAERVIAEPNGKHQPHFLGAVVLQQMPNQSGLMQQRTIIDGQQRLTTLQLLLDALSAQLTEVNALACAARIEPLVTNAEPFCSKAEDRFKVWPTNRDRPAFNEVMAASAPVDHASLRYRNERMVQAHRYFSEQVREWLNAGGSDLVQIRATSIERAARELVQLVVIDLSVDENAQEIFETLNARGAQLTAADLIKNFIFQRLLESGANVEDSYEKYWKDFETGFWEVEVSVGRFRHPRSSVFLNHWLIAQTGEEVVAREVFDRFKRFADHDAGLPMESLLKQIHAAAGVYRNFIEAASKESGSIDRLGLFGYRTSVLESEVIKPLILALLDPQQPPIPAAQLEKSLNVIESWMVRRMLVRATAKNYNQIVAEIIRQLRGWDRATAGDKVEAFLAGQTAESLYWPDDAELEQEITGLQAYRRLRRGRLRMVLEALEDQLRGWKDGKQGLGGERVARGSLAIEHVMPRRWQQHWPLQNSTEEDRDGLIHTFGNLTLLTTKLNSTVSNGPWLGTNSKRAGLERHDVLILNRDLLKAAGDEWVDEKIRRRSQEMARWIAEIWAVPANHRSGFAVARRRPGRKVELLDLINAGHLQPGMILVPRRKKFSHRVATLLADGRVDVDGQPFENATEAATAICGKKTGGWWLFLTDPASRRSLRAVRRDYIEAMAVDSDDDEQGDDEDDDET
ncbi:GmrSD restriction endonuclease domain-containing protein [Bradyrhizobium sp. 5.13L]